MKNTLLLIGLFAIIPTMLFAENVMISGDVSGNAQDTVIVEVDVENDDEFVGFQFDLPLPEEVTYLEDSAELSDRADQHVMVARIIDDSIFRVLCYSFNQTPFEGNDGTILNFRLILSADPGDYRLSLDNAIIANAESENILTNVQNGTLTIIAPDIEVNPVSLNFGEVALEQHADRSFEIRNDGNEELNVTRIFASHHHFSVMGDTAFTINPQNSRNVSIRFTAEIKGNYNQRVLVVSDDPDEDTMSVALSVYAFAVNELDVNDAFGRSGHTTSLTLDIENMEPFAGFQFDLILPDVMDYAEGSVELTERAQNHAVSAAMVGNNRLRVVAFSPTNASFTGNEGDVVELTFNLEGRGGWYNISLENPIIADTTGENIISDFFNGRLEIASPDIWVNPGNIDFGEVSILDTNRVDLEIGNNGSDTLFFDNFHFNNEAFFAEFDVGYLIINNSFTIPVFFHSDDEDEIIGQLSIITNDPDENPLNIRLSGEAFVPNRMILDDIEVEDAGTASGSLSVENYEEFAAFQCDIQFPEVANYIDDSAELTNRREDHQLIVSDIGNNSIRILAFSMSQSNFTGEEGPVLTFRIRADGELGEYQYILSNAILANAEGENILAETQDGTVFILENVIVERELTFELAESWNMISINIIPPEEMWINENGPDVVRMLEQLRIDDENHHVDIFKNAIGQFYFPAWDFNNIPYWNLTEGYQIRLDEDIETTWSGLPIPFDTDIPLSEGWNIIAYLPTYELDASAPGFYVLSPIIDNVLIAKNNGGQFLLPAWNFSNMPPWRETQGYQVKVDADVVLNYPPEREEDALAAVFDRENDDHWTAPISTAENMSVLVLSCDFTTGNQVAAYDINDHIVGVGTVESDDRCGLAVWGDDPTTDEVDGLVEGEAFELRLWNSEQVLDLTVVSVGDGSGLVYDKDGFTVLEVVIKAPAPDNYYLSQAFPNPFNSLTKLAYGLPETGEVTIRIYDLAGHLVSTLINGQQAAGYHAVVWNGQSASTGVYFIHMETGEFKNVRKVVFIR